MKRQKIPEDVSKDVKQAKVQAGHKMCIKKRRVTKVQQNVIKKISATFCQTMEVEESCAIVKRRKVSMSLGPNKHYVPHVSLSKKKTATCHQTKVSSSHSIKTSRKSPEQALDKHVEENISSVRKGALETSLRCSNEHAEETCIFSDIGCTCTCKCSSNTKFEDEKKPSKQKYRSRRKLVRSSAVKNETHKHVWKKTSTHQEQSKMLLPRPCRNQEINVRAAKNFRKTTMLLRPNKMFTSGCHEREKTDQHSNVQNETRIVVVGSNKRCIPVQSKRKEEPKSACSCEGLHTCHSQQKHSTVGGVNSTTKWISTIKTAEDNCAISLDTSVVNQKKTRSCTETLKTDDKPCGVRSAKRLSSPASTQMETESPFTHKSPQVPMPKCQIINEKDVQVANTPEMRTMEGKQTKLMMQNEVSVTLNKLCYESVTHRLHGDDYGYSESQASTLSVPQHCGEKRKYLRNREVAETPTSLKSDSERRVSRTRSIVFNSAGLSKTQDTAIASSTQCQSNINSKSAIKTKPRRNFPLQKTSPRSKDTNNDIAKGKSLTLSKKRNTKDLSETIQKDRRLKSPNTRVIDECEQLIDPESRVVQVPPILQDQDNLKTICQATSDYTPKTVMGLRPYARYRSNGGKNHLHSNNSKHWLLVQEQIHGQEEQAPLVNEAPVCLKRKRGRKTKRKRKTKIGLRQKENEENPSQSVPIKQDNMSTETLCCLPLEADEASSIEPPKLAVRTCKDLQETATDHIQEKKCIEKNVTIQTIQSGLQKDMNNLEASFCEVDSGANDNEVAVEKDESPTPSKASREASSSESKAVTQTTSNINQASREKGDSPTQTQTLNEDSVPHELDRCLSPVITEHETSHEASTSESEAVTQTTSNINQASREKGDSPTQTQTLNEDSVPHELDRCLSPVITEHETSHEASTSESEAVTQTTSNINQASREKGDSPNPIVSQTQTLNEDSVSHELDRCLSPVITEHETSNEASSSESKAVTQTTSNINQASREKGDSPTQTQTLNEGSVSHELDRCLSPVITEHETQTSDCKVVAEADGTLSLIISSSETQSPDVEVVAQSTLVQVYVPVQSRHGRSPPCIISPHHKESPNSDEGTLSEHKSCSRYVISPRESLNPENKAVTQNTSGDGSIQQGGSTSSIKFPLKTEDPDNALETQFTDTEIERDQEGFPQGVDLIQSRTSPARESIMQSVPVDIETQAFSIDTRLNKEKDVSTKERSLYETLNPDIEEQDSSVPSSDIGIETADISDQLEDDDRPIQIVCEQDSSSTDCDRGIETVDTLDQLEEDDRPIQIVCEQDSSSSDCEREIETVDISDPLEQDGRPIHIVCEQESPLSCNKTRSVSEDVLAFCGQEFNPPLNTQQETPQSDFDLGSQAAPCDVSKSIAQPVNQTDNIQFQEKDSMPAKKQSPVSGSTTVPVFTEQETCSNQTYISYQQSTQSIGIEVVTGVTSQESPESVEQYDSETRTTSLAMTSHPSTLEMSQLNVNGTESCSVTRDEAYDTSVNDLILPLLESDSNRGRNEFELQSPKNVTESQLDLIMQPCNNPVKELASCSSQAKANFTGEDVSDSVMVFVQPDLSSNSEARENIQEEKNEPTCTQTEDVKKSFTFKQLWNIKRVPKNKGQEITYFYERVNKEEVDETQPVILELKQQGCSHSPDSVHSYHSEAASHNDSDNGSEPMIIPQKPQLLCDNDTSPGEENCHEPKSISLDSPPSMLKENEQEPSKELGSVQQASSLSSSDANRKPDGLSTQNEIRKVTKSPVTFDPSGSSQREEQSCQSILARPKQITMKLQHSRGCQFEKQTSSLELETSVDSPQLSSEELSFSEKLPPDVSSDSSSSVSFLHHVHTSPEVQEVAPIFEGSMPGEVSTAEINDRTSAVELDSVDTPFTTSLEGNRSEHINVSKETGNVTRVRRTKVWQDPLLASMTLRKKDEHFLFSRLGFKKSKRRKSQMSEQRTYMAIKRELQTPGEDCVKPEPQFRTENQHKECHHQSNSIVPEITDQTYHQRNHVFTTSSHLEFPKRLGKRNLTASKTLKSEDYIFPAKRKKRNQLSSTSVTGSVFTNNPKNKFGIAVPNHLHVLIPKRGRPKKVRLQDPAPSESSVVSNVTEQTRVLNHQAGNEEILSEISRQDDMEAREVHLIDSSLSLLSGQGVRGSIKTVSHGSASQSIETPFVKENPLLLMIPPDNHVNNPRFELEQDVCDQSFLPSEPQKRSYKRNILNKGNKDQSFDTATSEPQKRGHPKKNTSASFKELHQLESPIGGKSVEQNEEDSCNLNSRKYTQHPKNLMNELSRYEPNSCVRENIHLVNPQEKTVAVSNEKQLIKDKGNEEKLQDPAIPNKGGRPRKKKYSRVKRVYSIKSKRHRKIQVGNLEVNTSRMKRKSAGNAFKLTMMSSISKPSLKKVPVAKSTIPEKGWCSRKNAIVPSRPKKQSPQKVSFLIKKTKATLAVNKAKLTCNDQASRDTSLEGSQPKKKIGRPKKVKIESQEAQASTKQQLYQHSRELCVTEGAEETENKMTVLTINQQSQEPKPKRKYCRKTNTLSGIQRRQQNQEPKPKRKYFRKLYSLSGIQRSQQSQEPKPKRKYCRKINALSGSERSQQSQEPKPKRKYCRKIISSSGIEGSQPSHEPKPKRKYCRKINSVSEFVRELQSQEPKPKRKYCRKIKSSSGIEGSQQSLEPKPKRKYCRKINSLLSGIGGSQQSQEPKPKRKYCRKVNSLGGIEGRQQSQKPKPKRKYCRKIKSVSGFVRDLQSQEPKPKRKYCRKINSFYGIKGSQQSQEPKPKRKYCRKINSSSGFVRNQQSQEAKPKRKYCRKINSLSAIEVSQTSQEPKPKRKYCRKINSSSATEGSQQSQEPKPKRKYCRKSNSFSGFVRDLQSHKLKPKRKYCRKISSSGIEGSQQSQEPKPKRKYCRNVTHKKIGRPKKSSLSESLSEVKAPSTPAEQHQPLQPQIFKGKSFEEYGEPTSKPKKMGRPKKIHLAEVKAPSTPADQHQPLQPHIIKGNSLGEVGEPETRPKKIGRPKKIPLSELKAPSTPAEQHQQQVTKGNFLADCGEPATRPKKMGRPKKITLTEMKAPSTPTEQPQPLQPHYIKVNFLGQCGEPTRRPKKMGRPRKIPLVEVKAHSTTAEQHQPLQLHIIKGNSLGEVGEPTTRPKKIGRPRKIPVVEVKVPSTTAEQHQPLQPHIIKGNSFGEYGEPTTRPKKIGRPRKIPVVEVKVPSTTAEQHQPLQPHIIKGNSFGEYGEPATRPKKIGRPKKVNTSVSGSKATLSITDQLQLNHKIRGLIPGYVGPAKDEEFILEEFCNLEALEEAVQSDAKEWKTNQGNRVSRKRKNTNPLSHLTATSAANKRRAKRSSRSPEGSYWDCSVCTYRNKAEAFKCAMCDVRKGTSTRKPRLNAQLVAQQQAQQNLSPLVHVKTPKTTARSPAQRKPGTSKKPRPRLKNVDRSSAISTEVVVNNVPVIITEYKEKSHTRTTIDSDDASAERTNGNVNGL